jgi:hypothetical protein
MFWITVFLEKLTGPKLVVVLIFLESDKVRHFTSKRRYVYNISPFWGSEIQIDCVLSQVRAWIEETLNDPNISIEDCRL